MATNHPKKYTPLDLKFGARPERLTGVDPWPDLEAHGPTDQGNPHITTHNVIYLMECSKGKQGNQYVGQTTRTIKTRLAEHRAATNNEITPTPIQTLLTTWPWLWEHKVSVLEKTTNSNLLSQKYTGYIHSRQPSHRAQIATEHGQEKGHGPGPHKKDKQNPGITPTKTNQQAQRNKNTCLTNQDQEQERRSRRRIH